ncbi:T9SS type A sorting domain-containing protein [Candidatus Latescibacterota bacterium]
MTIIQTACDWFTASTWPEYRRLWSKENKTELQMMEEQHPVLYYLRKAHLHALEEISNTEVTFGLVIWYMYNMGYVFKTPESCFGIDIHMREAERLVNDLDFLLISHDHSDHFATQLLDAMIVAGKPVITRWYPGSTIVTENSIFNFGNIRVKIDLGDHSYEDQMLMYQVDCGETANNTTIYHSGDNNNIYKMLPDNDVDIFMPHISVGMSIPLAIQHIKPRITFPSHILELAHSPIPPKDWRHTYNRSFDKIRDIPPDEAYILTWGERWLIPGTSIKGEIASPYNLVVSDVQNDNGHQLQLNWTLSPDDSIIAHYNIYRSRNPELNDPVSLESFDTLEALNETEQQQTILIGKVDAGENTFTDTGVPLNNVNYYYWIASVSESGQTSKFIPSEYGFTLVEERLPLDFKLYENYPNPFNPVTTILYSLPQDGHMTLTIYNISGQLVRVLKDEFQSAGKHSITWNAADMPSGLYFSTLKVNGITETRKMMLVK